MDDKENRFSKLSEKQKRRAGLILVIILTSILFMFMLFQFNSIRKGLSYVLSAIAPILYGLGLAYLINPIATTMRNGFTRLLSKKMKNKEKAKSIGKTLSIILSTVIILLLVAIIVWLVIPQLYESIAKLVSSMPGYLKTAESWYDGLKISEDSWANILHEYIYKGIDSLSKWFESDLMSTLEKAGSIIISGAIEVANFLFNVFLGFIVAIYALIEKDKFVGQSKKLLYSVVKTERANKLLDTARHADKIFGGFLTGKILAAFIFAILSIIILSLLRVPYALLVSVVIAVFNLIPVFGPIIGAVPCAFIILLDDPWACLIFLIVDILLQLLDMNIITPKLLGNTTGLSPFWVMFALLFFGGLFGFIGMLLGVPFFGVLYYIINNAVSNKAKKKGLPVNSTDYDDVGSINPETHEITEVSKEEEATMGSTFKFIKKNKKKK